MPEAFVLRSIQAVAVLAAIVLASSRTSGQPAPQRPQTPVFRAGTDVVPLTVTVLDPRGVPVIGLTAADFTVRENGRLREIVGFFPQTFGSALPARTGDSAGFGDAGVVPATRRTFLIVLGNGRIQHPTRALDGAIEFVRKHLLPQDAAALVAFHRATSFTTDHERIATILERYREAHERIAFDIGEFFRRTRGYGGGGPPLPASMLAAIDRDLFDGIAGPADGDDPDALSLRNTSDLLLGMDVAASMRDRPWQQQPTFQDLQRLADRGGFSLTDMTILSSRIKLLTAIEYLRFVEGDKHVVFLAGDSVARGADDARVLAARANGARVSVEYVSTNGTSLRGMSGCPPCRDVAELSGGSYTSVDYADRALASVDQTSRSSYLIGYVPADTALDGAYREVDVTVNRPGLIVRFRRGYFAAAEVEPLDLREVVADARITGALVSRLDARDIDVQVEASAVTTGGNREVRAEVIIDVRPLVLDLVDGVRTGRVELHVYCGDNRQATVGERIERLDLEANAETWAEWRESGLRRTVKMPVSSPARYVKVIVYDYGSDRVGSRAVTVAPRDH